MAGEREGGVAGGIAKPRSHTLHNLYAAAAETADSAEAPWEHLHVAFWETWMADSGSVTTKQVLSEIMSLHTRTHRFITFMQTTFPQNLGQFSLLRCSHRQGMDSEHRKQRSRAPSFILQDLLVIEQ